MLVEGKMNNMVKVGKKKNRWNIFPEFWNFIYFAELEKKDGTMLKYHIASFLHL